MADSQGRDFFISYTQVNRPWAEWIAVQLEAAGYTTLLQAWDFRPGRDFLYEMQQATATVRRTIAVLSPAYFGSAFGEAEWRAAFAKDPTGELGLLIPVRVQECEPAGLLASRVYIDLVDTDEATAKQRLLVGVDELGARPSSAPFPGVGAKRFPGQGPTVSNLPAYTRFIEWIADHSSLSVREAYDRFFARIGEVQNIPESERRQRAYSRGRLTRGQFVAALERYYAASYQEGCGLYRGRIGGHTLVTSVLTKPEWLQARVGLDTSAEHFEFIPSTAAPIPTPLLEGHLLDAAVDRLAQAELSTSPLVNNPIYQLLRVTVEPDRLQAAVTLVDFATYALTMDLLEAELTDALAELTAHLDAATTRDQQLRLPLRDVYLPTVSHALDFERRICAGGPVALLAAARPGHRTGRRPADYVLLVQERSLRVLNVVGRLAVVPKAFHGPSVEPWAEANLSTSVHRELEEELLGRDELDNVFNEGLRKVDPFHADLLSGPLRWLLDHQDPSAYRLECLGFGVNLLTGNYEFPCLMVISDEEWWARFGGQLEANWEIERVKMYSSRDAAGLQDLLVDPRWSNEGLFAFMEGLRRLAELDTASRVSVPEIHVEA